RPTVLPLQTLQRLPPQYRLMFTRAMHPVARLDPLMDGDMSAYEPSLTSAPHSGLKQRLLAALFVRAQSAGDRSMALHHFFRSFRQYEALVLWRAQFVTRTKLLLRFVPLHVAMSRSHAARTQSASSTLANAFTLLAEYDIRDARFSRIWDTGEDALYDEVAHRLDTYRVPMAAQAVSARAPSVANDVYLRDSFESTQSAIRSARSGGLVQAVRKASALLPFPPQCMQESPLLDPSRFQCNLRTRQTLEKFRPVGLAPIRFYDRRTGAAKFVLSPTPNCSLQLPDDMASGQHNLSDADPLVDVSAVHGASVLASGAVLMPTGGTEELDLQTDTTSSAAQSTPSMAPQSAAFSSASQKAGVSYLFHPTLPLVLSTRSDRGVNVPLSTSNIHFWQAC
ncbi:hypothetical protein IWW50_000845, partial [Coemansia erecta]